jgi:2,3-bisphosphoglycerate-dependent phosphoglycerate mutase
MSCLFLVRHCEATGQEPTAPLTPLGRSQAGRLADHLAALGADLLVSSPYARAQESIGPLAERLGLPVETDARLAERALSGAPLPEWRDAIARSFADLELAWPGGESSIAAMARGRAAIDDVLALETRAAVVVTHGNLMTLILRSFDPRHGFATWAGLSNPDVYRIARQDDRADVTRAWPPG